MVKTVKLLKQSHDSDNSIAEQEDEGMDQELVEHTEDIQGNLFVTSCRCATHMLQLCVIDYVVKHHRHNLQSIRNVVKKLKKIPYRNAFSANKNRKPFLDVPTRWNSSYDMIECLLPKEIS